MTLRAPSKVSPVKDSKTIVSLFRKFQIPYGDVLLHILEQNQIFLRIKKYIYIYNDKINDCILIWLIY